MSCPAGRFGVKFHPLLSISIMFLYSGHCNPVPATELLQHAICTDMVIHCRTGVWIWSATVAPCKGQSFRQGNCLQNKDSLFSPIKAEVHKSHVCSYALGKSKSNILCCLHKRYKKPPQCWTLRKALLSVFHQSSSNSGLHSWDADPTVIVTRDWSRSNQSLLMETLPPCTERVP